MLTELEREIARVAFLPINSGDGYAYGGGCLLVIGCYAIPFGEGQPACDLAKEVARRWNAALAAGEIKPEGE